MLKAFFIDKKTNEIAKQIEDLETVKEEYNSDTRLSNIGSLDSSCITKNVFYDIEMFKDFEGEENESIFKILSAPLYLKGSADHFKKLLLDPIYDQDILTARRKTLEEAMGIHESIYQKMDRLKELESVVHWINSESKDSFDEINNLVYFNSVFTKPLNSTTMLLTLRNFYKVVGNPMVGILTPFVYFIVPYIIVLFTFKGIKIGFYKYMKFVYQGLLESANYSTMSRLSYGISFVFYFQGILNSVELSSMVNRICKIITTKMNELIEYIKISELVVASWIDDTSFWGASKYAIREDYKNVSEHEPYSIFSMSLGKKLQLYKTFEKDLYKDLFQKIYEIDVILNIVHQVKERHFCLPSIIECSDTPIIKLEGLFHPYLPYEENITNDIIVDKNWIITGPNAGGKSTLIKSIVLSILLSQTLSISNSKSISYTPFSFINSQMNVPDCKGKESLFETEMFRSKSNLETLETKGEDAFTIMIMDEIFNSTNPVEGICGAYAIIKEMSKYKNNIVIVTTHYTYLTKLSKEFPEQFANFKMEAIVTDDDIQFPYKIKKGISNQYIALDILKHNGFDSHIIEQALEIKSRFKQEKKNIA